MAVSRARRVRFNKKSTAKKKPAKRATVVARPSLPPKLTPPRPARLYARERLYTLLDRETHPVVWIAAPAGSGKTSLAAGYLAARKRSALWYQLDSGDGDVASFFYHLSLLARQAARFRTPLPFLTPEYLADIPTFARNFFREFFRRMPKHGALVFDNYQEVPETSYLHDVLSILVDELPEGVRLFVLSRLGPSPGLARLQLSGQLAVVSGAQILLTPVEMAGLVALRTGVLDDEVVHQLYVRTQGWMAGVILLLEQGSGERVSAASLPADPKLLFDYFASEILDRSDPVTREFLLKTALLPQISMAAAKALTGTTQAREILEHLTRRNYFTVRHAGPEGGTYQYHPLFREFLNERGRRIFSVTERLALCEQAASLLAAAGQIEEAAELLRESGGEALLAALIGQHAPALAAQGRLETLEGWLRGLPGSMIEAQPWLSYWLGICRMPHDLRVARDHIEQAYRGFETVPDPMGLYLAWTGIIETVLYEWDDFSPADRWIGELKSLRERFPLEEFPMVEVRVVSNALHILTMSRADDPDLSHWVNRAETLLQKFNDNPAYVYIGIALYFYYSWHGNLARMREITPVFSAHLVRGHIEPLAQLTGYAMVCQAHWLLGDIEKARDALAQAYAQARQHGIHLLDALIAAEDNYIHQIEDNAEEVARCVARLQSLLHPGRRNELALYKYSAAWLAIERGEFARARTFAEQAIELNEILKARFPAELCRVKLAQTLVEFGEFDAARGHLEVARAFAGRMGSPFFRFFIDLVEAWICWRAGQLDVCADVLCRVLAQGREEGRITYVSQHGRHIATLCAFALERGIETEYVCQLIMARKLRPPENMAAPELWPYPLRLKTFGRFSISVHGKHLSLKPAQRKPAEVLQTLVAFGAREVEELQIVEALWPDAEGDAGRHSLKTNVYRLRQFLPEDVLRWENGRLSLDATRVGVDQWDMERALERFDRMPADSLAIDPIQRVLGLYRGEFLAGYTQSWALAARERIHQRLLRVVTRAVEAIALRNPAIVLPVYEKLIELDPLRESLYQGLMRCHHAMRQPAEGMRAYQRCRTVLKRELGLEPSAATEAIQAMLRDC